MIGMCKDIFECENKLRLITKKIKLLGEFALSIEEVDKLGIFIKNQISGDIHKGTEFLKSETPTCLAYFLVWMGVLHYKNGDYWSAIKDSIGLSDPNWQIKWGEIFINFLESNGLPSCDIKDAHRYVTPILIHGMIPNACLDEYFEKTLVPLFNHELTDSNDSNEIIFLLQNRREDNNERKGIEEKVSKLQIKRDQISNERRKDESLINIWDDLEKIKVLEAETCGFNELVSLPENPSEYKEKLKSAIHCLQREIEDLEKNERQYVQEMETYSEQDKQILAHSDEIVQCISILPALEQGIRIESELKSQEISINEQLKKLAELIFSGCWDERYGEIIRNLPFDKLKEKIEELRLKKADESLAIEQRCRSNIFKIIRSWVTYILSFFRKKNSKTDRNYCFEIREMLNGLPIEVKIEQLQTEFVGRLELLKDTYENLYQLSRRRKILEEENCKRIIKIKNVAEVVGVDITDNIGYMVTVMQDKIADSQKHKDSARQAEQKNEGINIRLGELVDKKQSLVEELQGFDKCFAKLGEGDIQVGIERYSQLCDTRNKAKSLRVNLGQVYPDLDSLEQEKNGAQQNGKDREYYKSEINRLDEEGQQIKEEMNELVEKLEQIPAPFPYVDEPIRRFLLYGGDNARNFFVQSVQMANQTFKGQKVPSENEIGLPQRVVTRFEEWWKEYENIKIKEEAKAIISLQEGEKFRAPVITLDTSIGEINVHFPQQRFLNPKKNDVCLMMNEGKLKERLRLYNSKEVKGLMETEGFDFSLPFPLDSYEFYLKKGNDIIKSWSPILGLCFERPFMTFDYDSKRLIQGTELPKGKILIILHNRFELEPERIIIEKCSLYGKWREYKYLVVDLNDVEEPYIVDEQGKKYPLAVSQERIFEPTLYGGKILRGCHSEEESIYIGEPPVVSIPIQGAYEIKRWLIFMRPNTNSTLTESIHYRLNELGEILDINVDKGICKIPLSNEKCLGKNPIGKFTVRLKNDIKHIDKQFSFCVVPPLKVEFDKNIYLPSEGEASQIVLTLDGVEKVQFEPRDPAEIVKPRGHSCKIETNFFEHSIHGMLKYPFSTDESIIIPITIQIPRLTWRLDGLQNDEYSSESNRIEEIWFGDWEESENLISLIVTMPFFINGRGQLVLRNSDQRSEAKIIEGKARFDLLRFSDTLKAGIGSLQTFALIVSQSEFSIDNAELFKVRTKWEVEGIQCIQSLCEEKINLQVSWKKEHGKAGGQRVIRLWRVDKSDHYTEPSVVQEIPEGAYSVEISEEQDNLLPGSYRIHIDVEELWSATEPSIPSQGSLNTVEIQIQIQKEILQGQIDIVSVIDENDQMYRLNSKYSVHIEGKIIGGKLGDSKDIFIKEGTNEGWYVGNISSRAGSITEAEINQVNPLKFEYNSTKRYIEDIEDKDGDGLYFCTLCKKFVWNEKDHEVHKSNLLMGNYKCKTNNKS